MLSSRRAALCAACVAVVAAVGTGASGAQANVAVGASGTSLELTSNDAAGATNGTTVGFDQSSSITVSNQQGVSLDASAAGACVTTTAYEITCQNVFGDLQATYGASNDDIGLAVCFATATIALGDGTNGYEGAACDPATASVSAGSGQDNLYGSSDVLSKTVEQLHGGGGDDALYGGGGDDVIYGGDGADTLDGGAGNDQVYGEAGNDIIRGAAGNDTEDGGPGDDRIGFSAGVSNDDDQGADVLRGGDGNDHLYLDGHTGGVTITLDGQANDGSPGEGDNVASDFEAIDGTNSNDTFTGSAGPDQFSGGLGDDIIHGGDGDDHLYGGSGDDHVYGDAGNDKVEGANGSDVVDGGPGVDQIYGDIGSCSFSCSSDADTVYARDGEKDAVDCGGGADTAQVDAVDVVAFCASVDSGPPAAGTGPGTTPAGTPPGGSTGTTALGAPAASTFALTLPGTRHVAALLAHGVVVQLTCPAACAITTDLRRGTKTLGTAHKSLLKAGRASITLKVATRSRRAVRRLKRGTSLTVHIRVTDAAGKATTLTRTLKL